MYLQEFNGMKLGQLVQDKYSKKCFRIDRLWQRASGQVIAIEEFTLYSSYELPIEYLEPKQEQGV
jgi:hypothetical protein